MDREEEQQLKAYEEVRKIIEEKYRPLHGHLYQLHGWKVTDSFSEAVKSNDIGEMRAILTEEHPGEMSIALIGHQCLSAIGVYTCDILSKRTCHELVEEVHNFEKWCKDHQLRVNRPNSMNKYGAILDDFGLQPVLDK